MKRQDLKKWEDQARRFFGNDFWEDILSVLPDSETSSVNRSNDVVSHHPPNQSVARPKPPAQPAIDVCKTDKQYLVLVELPGLRNVDDIEVYMHGGQLFITGTAASPYDRHKSLLSERFKGDFKRIVSLPEPIEEDKIDARYVNGILEIRLPFRSRPKEPKKRIRIETDP
ncbi:Hsp20/alpha crystallin family protein [Tumebacillus flagellatus]|uniref:SHSP domain-containing protein n=1 Tax=Tumebacillus flagellatus TaxID=1157490 RepID=A0A074LNY8_9BACL|nr:Hsp20/alpha crystallin family protein [Tumebacillus flagellatus]KEO83886.1 hypothetical protein EL26_08200 [Tumebacillus flagellatus]